MTQAVIQSPHTGFSTPEPPVPIELYVERRWYACRTRSRAEKKVEGLLDRAGFETYLPLVAREMQWADRKKAVAFPWFPGHLFARFCLTELHEVLRLPGVASILQPNGYPTPVRDEEFASLRIFVEDFVRAPCN